MGVPFQYNRKQYLGSDGKPITSGYLWVGKPNMDPKITQNQITVYSDPESQTALLQPIRTDAYGRPLTEIYVDLEYGYVLEDEDSNQIDQSNYVAVTSENSQWRPQSRLSWTAADLSFVSWTASTKTLVFDVLGMNVSATSLLSDEDQIQANRALQISGAGWTVYADVTDSTFTTNTRVTCTVRAAGTPDATLSTVNVGILTPTNQSATTAAIAYPLAPGETAVSVIDWSAKPYTSARYGLLGDGADESSKLAAALALPIPYLHILSGTYIVHSLAPPNDMLIFGDGMGKTILQFAQSNQSDKNMFGKATPWSNFTMRDLTLKGSLDYQASAFSATYGYAVYVRDAINNVAFEGVEVTKFGDQSNTSGGGIVLGYPSSTPAAGYASSNVKFKDCIFDHNGNVPGLYFSQGGTGGATNIVVEGNRFTGGYNSAGSQNCIYILGTDASRYIKNLRVTGNVFDIKTNIDQCVELNWIDGLAVNANLCEIDAGVSIVSGHILLRDGCKNGTVTGNVSIDNSGSGVEAITCTRFASPGTGTIETITIDGNASTGFTDGIQVGEGSSNITAADNTFDAITGAAYKLAACSDVTVRGGEIRACGRVATLGTSGGAKQMRRVTLEGLKSRNNTSSNQIATVVAGEDIEGLVIRNCQDSGSAGSNYASLTVAAATGNVFDNNSSELIPIDPSYLTAFSQISLADTGPVNFTDGDTTPNVRAGRHFKCANTAPVTITAFDGGHEDQEIYVELDANTTVDFTGTSLYGNGGADLAGSATKSILCRRRGTDWVCMVLGV